MLLPWQSGKFPSEFSDLSGLKAAAAPALASVFNMFERQELSACAQMAAIIWTRRSHREKKEDKSLLQCAPLLPLQLLGAWQSHWRMVGRLACSRCGDGQEKVQNSYGFIRPHQAFWRRCHFSSVCSPTKRRRFPTGHETPQILVRSRLPGRRIVAVNWPTSLISHYQQWAADSRRDPSPRPPSCIGSSQPQRLHVCMMSWRENAGTGGSPNAEISGSLFSATLSEAAPPRPPPPSSEYANPQPS